jgi:hypothetical protein
MVVLKTLFSITPDNCSRVVLKAVFSITPDKSSRVVFVIEKTALIQP